MRLPQVEYQSFRGVAHLIVMPPHSRDPMADYAIVEITYSFEAQDDWEATDFLNDWIELLVGERAEEEAGLDPAEWIVSDVKGAELYDAADCKILSVDAYGNQFRGRTTRARVTTIPVRAQEDAEWEQWHKGAWADEYTAHRDLTWGGWTGYYGLKDGPAHVAAIKAEIAAYCVAHGHTDLLLDKSVLFVAQYEEEADGGAAQ